MRIGSINAHAIGDMMGKVVPPLYVDKALPISCGSSSLPLDLTISTSDIIPLASPSASSPAISSALLVYGYAYVPHAV